MYEIQTLLVVIALIVVVAIGVRGVLGLLRYWRHRRNASALPEPDAFENIRRGPLDEQRALLARELLDDASQLPTHEMEVTHHALWMAMLLQAASDGSVDRREIKTVVGLFGQMTDQKLDYHPVAEAAELVRTDPKAGLAEIAKAKDFSDSSKQHVLAGAFLVSVSDRKLTEEEAYCLGDIADALAISPHDRKAVFEGITKWLNA